MYFIIFIAFVSGIAGWFIAASKNKDPMIWAVICAFFPISIFILLFMKAAEGLGGDKDIFLSPSRGAGITLDELKYDRPKWLILKDVDQDIAAAVRQVEVYGAQYEHELAERYLTLGDKSYLNSIVDHLLKRGEAEKETKLASEEKFKEFKNTEMYSKIKRSLYEANYFEVESGYAIVLPDFRCVQFSGHEDIKIYADLPEREKHYRHEKMWNSVTGERKQALIDQIGEDIAKVIHLENGEYL